MPETSVLDNPFISQRYFFPRREAPPEPFWVETGDARLACAYYKVNDALPTIVHFHGNGEVVADYLDGFPELLERMGCNCFLAEFRGYGGSSGIPQFGKMLKDVQPTIEATGIPQEKIILFGRSVGSLFAIKAAELFPEVSGLILESAIADPLERLLMRVHPEELKITSEDFKHIVSQAINIKDILNNFGQPVLIMHTRNDGLIDVSHAEKLAEWCAGPVRKQIFLKGSHNDIMFVNTQEYFHQVNEFVLSLKE